jgi:hypothetical protein
MNQSVARAARTYGLRRTLRAARLTSSGHSTLSVLEVSGVAGRPGVPGIVRVK